MKPWLKGMMSDFVYSASGKRKRGKREMSVTRARAGGRRRRRSGPSAKKRWLNFSGLVAQPLLYWVTLTMKVHRRWYDTFSTPKIVLISDLPLINPGTWGEEGSGGDEEERDGGGEEGKEGEGEEGARRVSLFIESIQCLLNSSLFTCGKTRAACLFLSNQYWLGRGGYLDQLPFGKFGARSCPSPWERRPSWPDDLYLGDESYLLPTLPQVP